jgi:hypothetical protein
VLTCFVSWTPPNFFGRQSRSPPSPVLDCPALILAGGGLLRLVATAAADCLSKARDPLGTPRAALPCLHFRRSIIRRTSALESTLSMILKQAKISRVVSCLISSSFKQSSRLRNARSSADSFGCIFARGMAIPLISDNALSPPTFSLNTLAPAAQQSKMALVPHSSSRLL